MLINLINTSLNTLTNCLFVVVGALHRLRVIVLFARCHARCFASRPRAVSYNVVCHHMSCACVTCATYICCSPCHALLACVDHVCRAASARDNKLFSLISTHVSEVNSSSHIC
jgi:hypothetical protein